MTTEKAKGQAMVWAALVIGVLVAIVMLVINGAALIQSRMALDRAAEDAVVSGLRTSQVGSNTLDPNLADKQARDVLRVELANLKWMSESPNDAASSAGVDASGNRVTVKLTIHVCPPIWPDCVPMTVAHTATIETTVFAPPAATQVPPVIIPLP